MAITIIAGPFGSGKSEIALALARRAAQAGARCALIDLDLVNPYFTSGQHAQTLSQEGIDVEQPAFGGTGMDVPAISGRVQAMLAGGDYHQLLVDAGGDAVGARVLGSLSGVIAQHAYDFLFVYNPYRPMVADPHDALALLRQIESFSRLACTGLIHNANLAGAGSGRQLMQGEAPARTLASLSGLPIRYHAGGTGALAQYHALQPGPPGQPLTLALTNRPAWL